jgi:hypothetical protein
MGQDLPTVNVPQFASIKQIMLHYNGLCERDRCTGRWIVPQTEELASVTPHFNWPHMLHDEALANHEKNITSILPTYFMDEADSNQYDRPRLDILVTLDDGTSVRYHSGADVSNQSDGIQKRRNRLNKLRKKYHRDWMRDY